MQLVAEPAKAYTSSLSVFIPYDNSNTSADWVNMNLSFYEKPDPHLLKKSSI